VIVAVGVVEGVNVAVTVSRLGVGDGPLVVNGMTSGVPVTVAGMEVTVAVGVGVAFPGITTQASQPMQ
jgi:hypothetical protein